MDTKTENSAYYIRFATIIASIILFVTSLGFPAFNLSNRDSYGGLLTLLMGWLGLFTFGDERSGGIGLYAWLANLFLIPAWLGLGLSKSRFVTIGGLACTIVGLGLASISVLIKKLPVDEAGNTIAVTLGFGFYLWLSSFVICVVGYFALISRAKLISNKAMVFLLPILPLILIFVGMSLPSQKETEVNIAKCEFDGADGLHTTLCKKARKVDHFDIGGSTRGITSSTLEAHNWQFPAQQGKQITIRMYTLDKDCLAIRMRIIDSQGVVIESFDHPVPTACTNDTDTVSMSLFDPPVDGTYTLRVDTPKAPGPYWFQIIEVEK